MKLLANGTKKIKFQMAYFSKHESIIQERSFISTKRSKEKSYKK